MKRIFMQRKPSEGVFHLNEEWYRAMLDNVKFEIKSKDDIDWV